MTPEQSIEPLNVAAATLLVQLLFIALLAITSSLYRAQRWASPEDRLVGQRFLPGASLHRSPTLFVALLSFAALLISDELYSTWSPIFQGVGINTISAAVAIGIVFILDLLLVGYLILSTGGSSSSPFLSALFTIPALAIFLRLTPTMFFTCALVASLIYLILLAPGIERAISGHSASAFMNISCLLLSMFTGYITRPVPINELKTTADQHLRTPAASAPSAAVE